MKILFLIIFLSTGILSYAEKTETDSLLQELDKTIENRDFYIKEKNDRITNLKQRLNTPGLNLPERYIINLQLHYEYKPFILDSAIVYTKRNIEIAKQLDSNEWFYESTLNLAVLYSMTGMVVEASDLLRNIPVDKLSEGLKIKYFDTYKHFYNYYLHQSEYYKKYHSAYRDTLLALYSPESTGYKMLYTEKLTESGQTQQAREILSEMLKSANEENSWRAILAYKIGETYEAENNYEEQKKYYAISAISDVKNATKENTSLRALALALYETGDIDRAYSYIQLSMEDAIFSNAQLRTIEANNIFPVIEKGYQLQIEKQKNNLLILLFCIIVLSLFLIVAVVYVYVQMKKLARARKTLSELYDDLQKTNEKVLEMNKKLSESNTLKEEYIARYMNEASAYLDKLEEYRRSLNKIAMTGKTEDLYKAIKSNRLLENELQEFYTNFDRSFLQLFPNFIQDFNNLLLEEDKIIPKQRELLNTELRIFALVRLGITDSNKIAQFLRYPVRTIYNYRTKVRNKAAGVRGEFEENVMRIGMPANPL